jgi:hypothetical protein
MRTLKELSTAELMAAALRYVQAEGRVEGSWPVAIAAAASLDADVYNEYSLGTSYRWEVQVARDKFSARVSRVLNMLADAKQVVKVGKGEYTPGGSYASNTTFWYTQEKWDAETAERQARKDADRQTEEAWHSVRLRLREGPGVGMDHYHALSLDDWEILLEKGGW